MSILKVILPVSILVLCLFSSRVHADMSSANYRITSTVMCSGGAAMSSTNFALVSTLGQSSPPGTITSDNFSIDTGFWYTLLLTIVGDVNGDGVMNLKDVISALQVVTKQTPEAIMLEADGDGDGKIGVAEAIMILRKLEGI